MYPGYKFEIAPIAVGAMGCVPKCLVTSRFSVASELEPAVRKSY